MNHTYTFEPILGGWKARGKKKKKANNSSEKEKPHQFLQTGEIFQVFSTTPCST